MPVRTAEAGAGGDGVIAVNLGVRVVDGGDVVAAGDVCVGSHRHRGAIRQAAADLHGHVVVRKVGVVALGGGSIGIAAVLHTVANLVEAGGRNTGLQRYVPNEVTADAERRDTVAALNQVVPRLPGMFQVPRECELLFRRNVVIEPGGGVILDCSAPFQTKKPPMRNGETRLPP